MTILIAPPASSSTARTLCVENERSASWPAMNGAVTAPIELARPRIQPTCPGLKPKAALGLVGLEVAGKHGKPDAPDPVLQEHHDGQPEVCLAFHDG